MVAELAPEASELVGAAVLQGIESGFAEAAPESLWAVEMVEQVFG